MKILFSRLLVAGLLTMAASSQAKPQPEQPGPWAETASISRAEAAPAAADPPAGEILSAPLLLKRCEALVEEGYARVLPGTGHRAASSNCYAFHDAMFAQVPGSYQKISPGRDEIVEWNLIRLDNQGVPTRVPLVSGAPGTPPEKELRLRNKLSRNQSSKVEIEKVFDFDADGRPEFMIEHRLWQVNPWQLQSSVIEIWTLNGNTFVPYEPALQAFGAKTSVPGSVEDVDDDARPDIKTSGHYASAQWFSCQSKSEVSLVSDVFLLHSQTDGTFSQSDAAAREHLKKRWCWEKPDLGALVVAARSIRPGGIPDHKQLVHAVVCARVWGQSAQEVLSLLTPTCPKLPESDCPDAAPGRSPSCPRWLQNLASIQPPFELR